MLTTLAGAAITALTTLSLAAPTSVTVADPADVDHRVDLLSVKVDNTATAVKVTLTHADLIDGIDGFPGGAVFLDTDRKDKGPELVFVGGYYPGTDYNLLETEGFGVTKWGDPVDGRWQLKLDYETDRSIMRMSRKSVGADKVRVAVRVNGDMGDETIVTDWMGEPRSYTRWLARAEKS